MKRLALILIPITFLFLSCNKNRDVPSLNTSNNSDINFYKEKALKEGDTSAYNLLSLDYSDSPYEEFLPIAQEMADKHKYHLSYLDVYYCLTDYFHKKSYSELEDLDYDKRKLAIKYLTLGAEKGNKDCQNILGHIYINGKHLMKDTIKGNELIRKSGYFKEKQN